MSISNYRPAMSKKEHPIPIVHNDNGDFVNARDLHNFLKVKTDFSDWINRKIKEYGFEENLDFVRDLKFEESKKGTNLKHKLIDYIITFDMAKELSMLEKNEMGRKARKYFIEMEQVATKRMYGEAMTLTEFNKICKPRVHTELYRETMIVYKLRQARIALGLHPNIPSAERERYCNLMVYEGKEIEVSQEYILMKIRNRTAINQRNITKQFCNTVTKRMQFVARAIMDMPKGLNAKQTLSYMQDTGELMKKEVPYE